jgi:alpha-tubulin suppressor-like RCC1 family protein
VPTVVPNLFDVAQIAPGTYYNAVALGDGTVRYWTGTLALNQEPGLANVKKIGVGDGFMCVLLGDGTVRCWGSTDGERGLLGDGTSVDHYAPAPVPSLHGVVDIAVDSEHSCALMGDGTVSCWGLNDFGQLGDGTGQHRLVPVAALGITSAVQIATGAKVSCAVLRDGTVRCWGLNFTGALGIGVIDSHHATPTAVSGLADVVEVATSGVHTCARGADGSVWCWGLNNAGQVGDGTTVTRPSPVRVLP